MYVQCTRRPLAHVYSVSSVLAASTYGGHRAAVLPLSFRCAFYGHRIEARLGPNGSAAERVEFTASLRVCPLPLRPGRDRERDREDERPTASAAAADDGSDRN